MRTYPGGASGRCGASASCPESMWISKPGFQPATKRPRNDPRPLARAGMSQSFGLGIVMRILWVVIICLWMNWMGAVPGLARAATDRIGTNAMPETPPEPAAVKSPIAIFRELLEMDPAERNKALADRSEESRKRILAKIREYQSLKTEERELRLKVTELGYYLRPLMRTPATNRAAQVSVIPAGYRDLVLVRLEKWDRLAPATQLKLLQNEAAIRSLTELTNGVSINAVRAPMLQNTISNWTRLSDKEQKELRENFDYFFQLKAAERQKAIQFLSKAEQAQIAATLKRFKELTPGQRAQCVQSFERLAAMTPTERQQFFKNAERWEMMTPRERENWRLLVKTAPMLPPVNEFPPEPPSVSASRKKAYYTNGN